MRIKGQWAYLYRAINEDGHMVDFFLSPIRSAKAAKLFLAKALYHFKEFDKPSAITTDKAPAYGKAVAALRREGKYSEDTEHRQVKYLNNRTEADHGNLKRVINPMRGFKIFRTAYVAIKGIEVMRALHKGRGKFYQLQSGPVGEIRLIERTFGLGPHIMTELMIYVESGMTASAARSLSIDERETVVRCSDRFHADLCNRAPL